MCPCIYLPRQFGGKNGGVPEGVVGKLDSEKGDENCPGAKGGCSIFPGFMVNWGAGLAV